MKSELKLEKIKSNLTDQYDYPFESSIRKSSCDIDDENDRSILYINTSTYKRGNDYFDRN